ncbi:UDP-N-acetylglucosamine 4,6-dehydratase [Akkermansiaceae bacterium]|nr:UDP-N-acetylglucosamine 4,6-dehydratase [Akkermansiaceae bacterium]MDA7646721.1 UDP-N-acetylglucosamine 4,6-dehydratase [Akkermansiaceae bacterium]MDB4389070.1 UDP-N-acetylglucosamine 4,6-dehydratase [Akkermansiaceae bacterium]MDB4695347.1 UDP-N-acetylglucosamine 4,6-dehydratase [Akkermansiaceae bacterium]
MDIFKILGRTEELFSSDVASREDGIQNLIKDSRILVIGGAGTIGQAVVREFFKRDPAALHVVDISENNLVELVRDVRSTLGYGSGEFQTVPVDVGTRYFDAFVESQKPYDYICNLSALKHVRSEKDPYTLMRMLEVNVFNTVKTARMAAQMGARKYFAVSTDKAANPVNLMGGSKRIMEKFLMRESVGAPVSMARFANVAFSDGSLLHGFNQRLMKRQPLSAPNDVERYFVTPQESGELCMMSAIFGENLDIFFPHQDGELELTKFSDIAIRFLESHGYEPVECETEDEARSRAEQLIPKRQWPVYFFASDTTGEKAYEEFFMGDEKLDLESFQGIGVIKNQADFDAGALDLFERKISEIQGSPAPWDKKEIVEAYLGVLPELSHEEKGKYLDARM